MISVIIMSASLYGQEPGYRYRSISKKEGLGSPEITWMTQDSRGFMWLGTRNGLYRYDGYQFKAFLDDPEDSTSLHCYYVDSPIFEDRDGFIWFSTFGDNYKRCLNRYDPFKDQFKRYYLPFFYPAYPDFSDWPNAFYQDPEGDLWLGTNFSGIVKFDQEREVFEKLDDYPLGDSANPIHRFKIDYNGRLWILTYNGFAVYDPEKREFEVSDYDSIIRSRTVNWFDTWDLYQDRKGFFWFASPYYGLLRLDPATNELNRYQYLPENITESTGKQVWSIREYPGGGDSLLLLNTIFGLCKFNTNTNQYLPLRYKPQIRFRDANIEVNEVYLDSHGKIWVANEGFGVDLLEPRANPFTQIRMGPYKKDSSQYTAISFLRDRKGDLWVGTRRGGVFHYNDRFQLIRRHQYLLDTNIKDRDGLIIAYTWVHKIYQDHWGHIWLGQRQYGLFMYDSVKHQFDMHPEWKAFLIENSMGMQTNDIYQDRAGDFWISSYEKIFRGQPDSLGNLNLVKYEKGLQGNSYEQIYEDHLGNLWFASGRGLFRLLPENRDSMKFIIYSNIEGDSNSINSDRVLSIYEDAENNLWVGTRKGLNLFLRESNTFRRYTQEQGMIEANVFKILGEENGRLWLKTDKGLARFDPREEVLRRLKVFVHSDGVPFEDICNNTQFEALDNFYMDDRGIIFAGGRYDSGDGFYFFNPKDIIPNEHIPPIVITGFTLHHKPYLLDTVVTEKSLIVLKHKHNSFEFEFAALDYTDPDLNQYAYYLEGFDEDWIYSGNRRYANYTKVPSGTYTFHVKGSNNDGIWNEAGTSVKIVIATPPWRSWWAWTLYMLFVFTVLIAVFWYYLKRQQLERALTLEQLEKEKLEAVDQIKSKFFANVSHEFRTPLSLIILLSEGLVSKSRNKDILKDIGIIRRNAFRIRRLVDQLLNLAKLESGNLKLNLYRVNMADLVGGYVQFFESLARMKEINLALDVHREGCEIPVDIEKLEIILYNLMSNAFKFTPPGGKIKVSVQAEMPSGLKSDVSGVRIKVEDSGIGIPEKQIDRIFDRFFQVKEHQLNNEAGMGIGLALVRELIELHGGWIRVESSPGSGTTFEVMLPQNNTADIKAGEPAQGFHLLRHNTSEKRSLRFEIEQLHYQEKEAGEVTVPAMKMRVNYGKPVLLIVDDNSDLRAYLNSLFSEEYIVILAKDGQQGFEIAIQHIPDMIISDVMMPKMDGYALCQALKADERTSHIPVILLTAKAEREDKVDGLTIGADDFISKPFDVREMKIRVANLISQRMKLRKLFENEFSQKSLPEGDVAMSSIDHKFLDKAKRLILDHLSDTGFTVEKFGKEMAMSRVQLHRKLKALIDKSASEFIRDIRLEKAAELLSEGTSNVAQVAYEVGFSSLSYFSKCFQKKFGKLPSHYK